MRRFFGFTADNKNPSPKALPAVMESMADIHFGMLACSPSAGRVRHCLIAKNSSSAPRMILMTPATGDGPPVSCGMIEESRVNKTMATTMPASHPNKNPTLVLFARGDSSIKIAAMIGIGLMAMPMANGRISPITSFTRYPRSWTPFLRHRSSAPGRPAGFRLSLSMGASTGSALVRPDLSSQPQLAKTAIAARLEQFGNQRRRTCGTVPLHRPIVDLPPDLLRDHHRNRVRRRQVEVHHATRAVLLESVAHVEVLLEVMAQRDVQERPARCCQFHACRQPALYDCQVAGGKVSVELRYEPAHFEALVLTERARIDPWPGNDNHPKRRHSTLRLRKCLDHSAQQVSADTGAADGDDADLFVVSVAEIMTQPCAIQMSY